MMMWYFDDNVEFYIKIIIVMLIISVKIRLIWFKTKILSCKLTTTKFVKGEIDTFSKCEGKKWNWPFWMFQKYVWYFFDIFWYFKNELKFYMICM